MDKSVLVALPAYNEEVNIKSVIEGVSSFGDVYVFNNNSTDQTKKITLASNANVIDVKEIGYENVLYAISDFFLNSHYTKLIILDGDGEVGMDSISLGISYLDNYNIVLGNRNYKKRWGERLICYLFNYFYGIKDIFCGFKCFKKEGLNTNKILGTFGTGLANKKQACKNIDVVVSNRVEDSKLGEGLAINIKLIFSGIKGLFS